MTTTQKKTPTPGQGVGVGLNTNINIAVILAGLAGLAQEVRFSLVFGVLLYCTGEVLP